MKTRKIEWNRQWRQKFAQQHGYSSSAHFATGGLREAVLQRDGVEATPGWQVHQRGLAAWAAPATPDARMP